MARRVVRVLACAALLAGMAAPAQAGWYLVKASHGPGYTSPEEELTVLENGILPTFEALMKLESDKKIVGGLPVGQRAFVFIMEAPSTDDADRMVRAIPAWGALDWKVVPLQSFKGRDAMERKIVADLKKKMMK